MAIKLSFSAEISHMNRSEISLAIFFPFCLDKDLRDEKLSIEVKRPVGLCFTALYMFACLSFSQC